MPNDFAVLSKTEFITSAFRKVKIKKISTSVRIHVERVTGMFKDRYNLTILKGPL